MDFREDQLERYSRHIILEDIGVEGQEKIMKGKVLIIGAGGLGAPAAMYLAAAGVGTIGIVDFDKVEGVYRPVDVRFTGYHKIAFGGKEIDRKRYLELLTTPQTR